MKATQLKVGNFVRWTSNQCLTKEDSNPFRIVAVRENEVQVEDRRGWYVESLIEPVPLTNEILEKNFRKDPFWSNAYYINDHIHIFYNESLECWQIQYNELIELRYVHELQNALDECKFSKQIEL